MHTFKIHVMKKHPMNVFCLFLGLGVRLRTILLHFLVLRKNFPGGSYIEVFLKWVL